MRRHPTKNDAPCIASVWTSGVDCAPRRDVPAAVDQGGKEMTLLTNRSSHARLLLTLAFVALVTGGPRAARADDDQVDALVGVWESVAPGQIDCQTRQPLPDVPIIRSVYTIHHGGTMSEENTDSIEGPYRSSGFGNWRRVSGRNYAAAYGHYGFVDENLMPSKQLGAVVRARTLIRLSPDARAF